ncbi:hypothetical protein B0H13DRAFT_2237517 [Mycena leptocephala]|nr:hypothetical protein B0H13DRAFT_2237517 [Mycena leptocephala]
MAVSFENGVALANYRGRLKHARKMVWRNRGQPIVDLPTLRHCLEHAGAGGLRAAGLAFTIRACFNVFMALINFRKVPRARWFALIRRAIFGIDSWRFAAMLGTFATLYKFIINALTILTPCHLARGQMGLVRKRTRRWHSALAGAIAGGLAILWEKRNRRVIIAQQVFVRGLQGSYNFYLEQWGLRIPYGAEIVFSLACGQIMWAFFLRPDTLPRSYVGWIQDASKVPADAFIYNRIAVHEHSTDLLALDRLIARSDITLANLSSLLDLRDRALAGSPGLPHYVPCFGLHPMADSCRVVAVTRFFKVARWILPPTSIHADPVSFLAKVSVGSLRSSAFLGAFVAINQGVLCIKHKLYEWLMAAPLSSPLRRIVPQRLIDVLISKGTWWVAGFSTGLALLVEDQRRRAELAIYVLPKGLESLWIVARGHGLVWHTGSWGEGILVGLGMAMVMTIYQNDPQHLSGLVRRILYQFIGPN